MLSINGLVGAAIGVVVLGIVMFTVAIPVITDAINNASLTGSAATIAELVPLMLVLGIFIIIVAVFVLNWL